MKFGISYVKDSPTKEKIRKICELLTSRKHSFEPEEEIPIPKMESKIILAVGDDANILRTFREIGDKDKLVFGIGIGKKSFLTEIETENFKPALMMLEKEEYFVEKRSRILPEINDKKLPYALNEIVISSTSGTTPMRYDLKVDDELIFRDFADGIIVSTPTGSTGYALSAGGPVISIKSDVFIAIPICSINQNKPFVMSDKSVVKISGISSRGKCEIVIDGRYRTEIEEKTVIMKRAPTEAKFIRFEKDIHTNVFRKLKKRAIDITEIPKDAPPSAKYIYKILHYEGRMTHNEIVDSSMLPARTVRSALNYLVEKNLIASKRSLRDMRQKIYFVV